MELKGLKKYLISIGMALCCLAGLGSREQAYAISASYLYDLSDFTGPFLYDGSNVYVDQARNEAYVVSRGIVSVFNENGMEIYRFNDGDSLGAISALDFDTQGLIYALSYKNGFADSSFEIIKCNYRGERIGSIAIKGLPRDFKEFSPRFMAFRDGQFYLADPSGLRFVVTDMNGQVRKSYDLVPLLELKESDRGETELGGFSVDKNGNMLFTVTVLFSAYVLGPDGKLDSFGQPGSLPGKFSQAYGILRDNRGNILVADKLRSVVNIFDRNFNFLAEFGGRGNAPGSLVIPSNMALDDTDRLFVSQGGKRGVSVFRLVYN